jgi:hypothetical protein
MSKPATYGHLLLLVSRDGSLVSGVEPLFVEIDAMLIVAGGKFLSIPSD